MSQLIKGMDKSLAYFGVIMDKEDTASYHKFPLPEGFSFCLYKKGMEKDWIRIQHEVGGIDSEKEAAKVFISDFLVGDTSQPVEDNEIDWALQNPEKLPYYQALCKKMLFILNSNGEAVAVGAVWKGDIFGKNLQRIHWIAVNSEYQNLGLSKVLISKLLDIYNDLGYKDYIYLTSQTWSYKALNVYSKFGFKPYMGEKPVNWSTKEKSADSFADKLFLEENTKAWEIIEKKLAER